MSGSFGHVLENFQITKNFRHLSGNFQRVSGNFLFQIKIKKILFSLSNDANNFRIAKHFRRVSGNFLPYTKILLFFYHMTKKNSGLLKKFWIAMLPCYRGFSLSAVDAWEDGQHIPHYLLWVREVHARGLDVEEPAPVGEDHRQTGRDEDHDPDPGLEAATALCHLACPASACCLASRPSPTVPPPGYPGLSFQSLQ